MRSTFWSAAALLAGASAARAASYTIAQNYTGTNFFSGWDFYAGIDTNTTGNVLYQSEADAMAQDLAYINDAGHAIIKVDNTTVGTSDTYGRASVKILSQDSVTEGSLLIMDAYHMPFGCSVWPAFWSQGVVWPNDGEIDIVENVNQATVNRYALHTTNGCTHPDSSVGETGELVFDNCYNATNGDEGCIVQESQPDSYGAGFASNGGGAFALLWNTTGIMIWFFPRPSIPSDVASASPDPDTWGLPSAFYPQSTCPTDTYFGPQTVIFDITLCGNFAGAADVFNQTCTGVCTDLIATPSNYNDAYFEVGYVRHFVASNGTSTASGSSSTSTGSSSSSKSAASRQSSTLITSFGICSVGVALAIVAGTMTLIA